MTAARGAVRGASDDHGCPAWRHDRSVGRRSVAPAARSAGPGGREVSDGPEKDHARSPPAPRRGAAPTTRRRASVPPTTEKLEPQETILGQDRAIRALRLGLEVYHRGYNVFVCGLAGTGKATTVKRVLNALQPACRLSADLCYVHNFDEPDRPLLIELRRGQAQRFRDEVKAMIRSLAAEIAGIVNSDEARIRKDRIRDRYQTRSFEVAAEYKERVEAAGFVLAQIQVGAQSAPDLLYVVGEDGVRISELDGLVEQGTLDAAKADAARAHYREFASQLADIVAAQQEMARAFQEAVRESDREAVSLILEGMIRALGRRFPSDSVVRWTKMLREAVLDNLEIFLGAAPASAEDEEPIAPEDLPVFDVNVILSNTNSACPVVVENNPTHQNVFGTQERFAVAPGAMGTDFTRIRPGALVRAQGGYLIMNAEDVLSEPGVWQNLKRSLRSAELVIQPPENPMGAGGPTLSPEPIKLEVKVVLVGSHGVYNALYEKDRDFAKIFKIKADFDSTIRVSDETITRYLDVMVRIVREDGLRDMTRGAVEVAMQQSMREAGQRERLSTRFSSIADLMREADYHAHCAGAAMVEAGHMRTAIEERRLRSNLFEELLSRQIAEGDVFIDVTGERIGQINGLTVLSTGDYEFGKPARITCRTAVGKSGFVNIEREVELTGSTFEKGLLIIQGFFNGRFAQAHPITFAASICFEQSYGYIDGDSASSTEIYVLMSSLAKIPLRQDLAVTGSVDQFGRIQPVGGVNEKIEGYFDTCQALGFTGTQGVLIPATNADELALADRVIDAVREGTFHIYPVAEIDDGIEILTGRTAGRRNREGNWTRNSINEAVQDAIDRLHRLSGESGS
ncbi:MAG: ATP-binding protein [Planctomycetota bacterium]